jgi:hypothetical protein
MRSSLRTPMGPDFTTSTALVFCPRSGVVCPTRSEPTRSSRRPRKRNCSNVGIGSVLHVGVAKFDDPNASTPSSFASVTLHVVGVATTPVGLLRGSSYAETFLFGTPAFARRFADRNVGSTVYVQLD